MEVPANVILDSVAGTDGSDHDDDQFMVQDTTPMELPDSQAFLPPAQAIDDKPEGIV